MSYSHRKSIEQDLLYILDQRMIVAKKRYPTDPRKQYLYSLGYLVGIITEVAAADNYAEHQLYHILKQLKKRGE